jgi:formylglycine-generating enzyme required for sulfatase activity
LSDQQVSGIPLPVDLGLVGIPGCNAYNSADIQFPLGVPSGAPLVTQWALAIPNDGVLLGLEIYLQALALEGFGFSRFATVTNGLAARIGNSVSVAPVPPPVAAFNLTTNFGATPLLVQFTDLSTEGAVSWLWDFEDDGVIDSNIQNPTHVYVNAGQFSVRLVVAGFGGSSTVLKSRVIFAGFTPNVSLSMTSIHPGSFHMGSNLVGAESAPVHAVHITRPFWAGRYEVTQSQYMAVMGSNPSYMQGPNWPNAQMRPVEQVTWLNAMAYCSALNAIESSSGRVPVGYQYRLPTEAEWEYFCRAGTATEWNTGLSLTATQANFSMGQSTIVGSYAPNPWGICDTHGNIFEWCLDSWDGSMNYPSTASVDPYVAIGVHRVVRSGSWGSTVNDCRSAVRWHMPPDSTNGVGFRIVLAPILVP